MTRSRECSQQHLKFTNWKRMMANFSKKTLLTVIGLLILIADPIRLHSDDSGPDPNRTTVAPTQNSKQQIKDQELNSQSEQLALQFVTDHLPQLKPILEQLKLDIEAKAKEIEMNVSICTCIYIYIYMHIYVCRCN